MVPENIDTYVRSNKKGIGRNEEYKLSEKKIVISRSE